MSINTRKRVGFEDSLQMRHPRYILLYEFCLQGRLYAVDDSINLLQWLFTACNEGQGVSATPLLDRHPPGQTPLLGRHRSWAHTPQADTPPGQTPPSRYPHPRAATPWADTSPYAVHAGIRSTSGRYASYWNAYFLKILLAAECDIRGYGPRISKENRDARSGKGWNVETVEPMLGVSVMHFQLI